MNKEPDQEQGASEVIREARMLRASEKGITEAVVGTATDHGKAVLAAHGILPNKGASQTALNDGVEAAGRRHQDAKQALEDKERQAQKHFENNQAIYIKTATREAEEDGHVISENPSVATKVEPNSKISEGDNDKPGFIKV